MKYYAVIDTKILVSAMLKRDSVPGNVLELAFGGTIIPLLNEHIVKEYREVLGREKFHFTKDITRNVLDAVKRTWIFVDADELDIDLPDPKDRVFLRSRYGGTEVQGRIPCYRQYQAFSS